MKVHLVNPSNMSFGTAVITPRWLYVLAAATPASYGDPHLVDETLESLDPLSIGNGDMVGISIHTGNTLRGYEIGRLARNRGAWVVFGGIHATLYPEEAHQLGGAHAVVKGDGDVIWASVLEDCHKNAPRPIYEAGRIGAASFKSARWDLLPTNRYMWASVQTVRGCPKHCSFCSVWRTDGQQPRQRSSDVVLEEIVELRRLGFRFIALADDNFYPVTLTDVQLALRQNNPGRVQELTAIRAERFELMARLAQLPQDTVFFTQITMEAAEDPDFLSAMKAAHILGALVGVEAVTPEGLKDVYKDFNCAGEHLVKRLRTFRQYGIHVLGSFIFGLPSDRAQTFASTAKVAEQAELTFAQFVMLTPYPGTVDFARWEKTMQDDKTRIAGVPLTRHWLIPSALRPKVYAAHPAMSDRELRQRTQGVWDKFYSMKSIWKRSRCAGTLKARMAFVLISKLYRRMYADTGIATDSARAARSARWARWIAKPCRRLFAGKRMPDLQVPGRHVNSLEPASESFR
ncbi:MAG TPA: radical SAM protein [Terriglobales bacterium]|jgi:radical SAM superfamily enzyme YgiQ (UPF0313 family)